MRTTRLQWNIILFNNHMIFSADHYCCHFPCYFWSHCMFSTTMVYSMLASMLAIISIQSACKLSLHNVTEPFTFQNCKCKHETGSFAKFTCNWMLQRPSMFTSVLNTLILHHLEGKYWSDIINVIFANMIEATACFQLH